jgi:methylmalonyl-CoA mutase
MSNYITENFQPTSEAAWKQKIQVDLKGANYNETLLTNTNEGITIKPIYHLDSFEKLEIPTNKTNFKICETIFVKSETEANNIALDVINRGAESLRFIFKEPFNLKELFNGLLNRNIEFQFDLYFLSCDFVQELTNYLINECTFFNIDIIGNLAKTGNWYKSLKEDFSEVKQILQLDSNKVFLSVNSKTYQNAGANTVQQVAYALSHANEYLTHFGPEIASKMQFNFATGSNYFFEISKIRAFRYLYHLVLKNYNTSANPHIFTEPTLRNKTLYDYNVNLLRTTTEGMSAILGGADTISALAYDSLFHKFNEFGSRIGRNQLLILKEESYFNNAQHIATDSYYIEAITKQIAEKALEIFKDIEVSGGFLSQLKEGTIQRKISENAKKEQTQFNEGKLVLLGTNKYPNELDKMKNDLEINPFLEKRPKKTLITPIIAKRLAETLEQKRLKDEA